MSQSDAQISRVLESSPSPAIIVDQDGGQILYSNGSLLTLLGWLESDAPSFTLSDLFADRTEYEKTVDGFEAREPSATCTVTLCGAGDTSFTAQIACPTIEYLGRPAYLIWISRSGDGATMSRESQDNVKMLRAFIENNPASILMKDLEGRFLMVNPAFERLHQTTAADIIGKTVNSLSDTCLTQHVNSHDQRVIETQSVIAQHRQHVLPNGVMQHRMVTKFPVFDSHGEIVGIGSIGHDITEQRIAEETFHNAIASMSEGFALFDANERLVLCNENYRRIFPSFSVSIMAGASLEELLRIGTEKKIYPAAYGRVEDFIQERLERFRNPSGPYEYRQANNRWIRSEERKTPNGGTVSIRSDVTERHHAIEVLREREAQLRLVTDSLPVLIAYYDNNQRVVMINKTGAEWYARPASEIIGKYAGDILGTQYEKVHERMVQALQGRKIEYETQISYPDGETRDIRVIYVPNIDPEGKTTGIFSLVEDITLINQTHEHLRQSQKMEALGQVTGGVAHEFNNLLMAITGNLELLLETELRDMPSASEDIKRVLESAFRGKDMTGRLLSYTGNPFSIPQRTDAGAAARQSVELFRPLLGATITIGFDAAPDLWPIRVDEGEFENALMNLALNGRDAMPDGGHLQIECHNVTLDQSFATSRPYRVKTGDYVRITVKDFGTGMSAEVARRAFDPFYTTKGVGKGTGLGLSMVYGFVHRQAQGYVDIETTEGEGTTVALYLPRAVEEELAEAVVSKNEEWAAPTEQRSALLVEDNAELRTLFVNMLKSLNFDALPVDNAASALDILSALEPNGHIDLLLTDVVLPGSINGIDLATRAQSQRPEMKVVLISGYPEADLLEKGLHKNQFPLLSKPFRIGDLLSVLEVEFAEEA